MPTVREVLLALETIAPARYAFEFDKVGLQVGDSAQEVHKAVVSLDRSLGAIEFAKSEGAQLLLAHHPLIFAPIATVDTRTHIGRSVRALVQADITFIAAHTNWDSAVGGVNDVLAQMLGLHDVTAFGGAAEVRSLKLVVPCPEKSVEAVIDAASAAGAGVIGAYSRCAFKGSGVGTFQGDATSNPAVGKAGQVEHVPEVRLEMVLPEPARRAVEKAVRAAHPYEEPAIDFFQLSPRAEQPAGRIGTLATPMPFSLFTEFIDRALNTRCMAWGKHERTIGKVAVVGGAADGEWMEAQRAGADAFVTGEVKQHVALEASESGMGIVAAGHYATEHPGAAQLATAMAAAMSEVEWVVFEPDPGMSGRPL